MKLAALLGFASLGVVACASTPKAPTSTTTTTSAAVTVDDGKTAAERWAEQKVAAERASAPPAPREAADPLAMNSELEASAIPKVELTPAKELRAKGAGDLKAGVAIAKRESTLDGALKKLVVRLGKPTWTENGQKRVWVALAASTCNRLIVDADGLIETDTASKTEWRSLTATAQQNPCTGEIRRGLR